MIWAESASEHFECRHSAAHEEDAARALALLERVRTRLAKRLPRVVDGITVVVHDTPISLGLSHPMMVMDWRKTAPSSRRYVTGWVSEREIHVLSAAALRDRASGVSGSFEMLRLAPASLYARRVILESNVDWNAARPPLRRALELRWAWLFEGAARWLSGESEYSRAVVSARVREAHRVTFPPTVRDAPILGPTVMEVLAQQQGEGAVAALCGRLPAQGPQHALTRIFGGKAIINIESDWRQYLRTLVGA